MKQKVARKLIKISNIRFKLDLLLGIYENQMMKNIIVDGVRSGFCVVHCDGHIICRMIFRIRCTHGWVIGARKMLRKIGALGQAT